MIHRYNATSSVAPFLSIAVTSYNRVHELHRCLASIDSSQYEAIEIVISEDCSPAQQAIKEMVEGFSHLSPYRITFNVNEINLGYDRNLGQLITLAEGRYVLFMSDDDSFISGALDRLLTALWATNTPLAFSPFFDHSCNAYSRNFDHDFFIHPTIPDVSKYIYCSILFSGLIFHKSTIVDYESARFKDLLYFQVYLFASVLGKHGGHYFNIPLVNCNGDGQNAFGTSELGDHNAFLADRKSLFSNLEYHKGLIQVLKLYDTDNGTHLLKEFSKEYSLRSYSGLARARKSGKDALDIFWKRMNNLDITITWTAKAYYYTLRLLGYTLTAFCLSAPKHMLSLYRRKSH